MPTNMYNRMVSVRVLVGYVLWRVGIKEVLPREIINRIPIVESEEPLVCVVEHARLKLNLLVPGEAFLRRGVLDRLKLAADTLPPSHQLVLVEGYRSRERQRFLWNRELEVVRRTHGDMPEEEIERMARLRVAQPSPSGGGHQTGAAVDVTLADASGDEIEMGTAVQEFTNFTPTIVKHLPAEILRRRQILLEAMGEAGFSNYPGEWWHFSFGDRLWAAYSRKPHAVYGAISEKVFVQ